MEERDSDFAFDMTLFKTLESEQTYSIRLIGITDTAGDDDFSVPEEEMFLFPPESETLTVFVNITGDTRIELTEQFFVRLLPFGGPPFGFEQTTVSTVVNIVDNDGGKFYYGTVNNYKPVNFVNHVHVHVYILTRGTCNTLNSCCLSSCFKLHVELNIRSLFSGV